MYIYTVIGIAMLRPVVFFSFLYLNCIMILKTHAFPTHKAGPRAQKSLCGFKCTT